MDPAAIAELQAHLFGEMDLQKSQFYVMHVVHGGGLRDLW